MILHWLDIRRLHSKKKKLKTSEPQVVDVPWAENTSKMASGIFTMRHMEVYMGASLQGCEKQMTTKNSKAAVKFMRMKYLHKLIMWEKNEFRYVLAEAMDGYRKSLKKTMPILVTAK